MTDRINFDTNGCYGLDPEVAEELARLLPRCHRDLLNPSSLHTAGQRARSLLDSTRDELAALLNLRRGERVIFTSGATEANNLVVWSRLSSATPQPGRSVVVSAIEHPSILEPLAEFDRTGFTIHRVAPSDSNGSRYTTEDFSGVLSEGTLFVSCMLANNETGEILPVAEIASVARSRNPGVFIHTDGVQAVGKTVVEFNELGVDALTISGHKIGALAGVGALIVRDERMHLPQIRGGAQEQRLRAGTENVVGIGSLGFACRKLRRDLAGRQLAMERNRELLRRAIARGCPECEILFDEHPRLPNTLSVRTPGLRADDLVIALDLRGVAASAGAACASGKPLPSHVLLAHGFTEEEAREVVRLSVSAEDSPATIAAGADRFLSAVHSMRSPTFQPGGVC